MVLEGKMEAVSAREEHRVAYSSASATPVRAETRNDNTPGWPTTVGRRYKETQWLSRHRQSETRAGMTGDAVGAVLVCACGPGGRRCGLMCVWYLR